MTSGFFFSRRNTMGRQHIFQRWGKTFGRLRFLPEWWNCALAALHNYVTLCDSSVMPVWSKCFGGIGLHGKWVKPQNSSNFNKKNKKIEPQCPISENGRVCLTCPLFLALHEESTQHAQNNNIYPIQSVSEYSMNFAGHCSEPAFSFWSVLQWKARLLIKTKGRSKCFDDVLSGSIFVQCEEGNVSAHWDLEEYLQSAMEAVWLKRLQRYFLWHGRSSF